MANIDSTEAQKCLTLKRILTKQITNLSIPKPLQDLLAAFPEKVGRELFDLESVFAKEF